MTERRNNEGKICELKGNYEQMEMSSIQLEEMKNQIAKGKIARKALLKKRRMRRISVAAAAVAAFVVLPNVSGDVAYAMGRVPILGKLVEVVTFRDYQYESERHHADIQVPELVAGEEPESDEAAKENMKQTTEQINAEIQKITSQIVKEFENEKKHEEGYQDVLVKHEIINTTQDYFTLKLICYQGAGSGAEWDYFYTIDLQTGERLQLKNLFREGADYITPISENIKTQMRQQMAEDEMKYYWVDEEIDEMNFKAITDETSFYINEKNELVIAFNEYDVAPGYMGCVEFVIPDEVIENIRM